jgi:hypothetical protein
MLVSCLVYSSTQTMKAMFLRNVGLLSPEYTTLYLRRQNSFKDSSIPHQVPTASEACSVSYPVSSSESPLGAKWLEHEAHDSPPRLRQRRTLLNSSVDLRVEDVVLNCRDFFSIILKFQGDAEIVSWPLSSQYSSSPIRSYTT